MIGRNDDGVSEGYGKVIVDEAAGHLSEIAGARRNIRLVSEIKPAEKQSIAGIRLVPVGRVDVFLLAGQGFEISYIRREPASARQGILRPETQSPARFPSVVASALPVTVAAISDDGIALARPSRRVPVNYWVKDIRRSAADLPCSPVSYICAWLKANRYSA